MPFHMVWSVLLRVLAQKTTFWLVEILWQPIRGFYSMVFDTNTRNKTDHTMWEGMENCARKRCLLLCTLLFQVTWAFWKMWPDPQLCKSNSSVLASIPDRQQQQPASSPCRKHWLSIDIEAEIQVTRASEYRSHVVGKSGRNCAWEGRKRTGIQHIRLPGNSPETQSFFNFFKL